jgi:3'-5' exoribonuclease
MKTVKRVSSLKEIDFENNDIIEFEATVLEVPNEGSFESKVPFRVILKLEESGERKDVVSWNFDALDLIKESVDNLDVLLVEGVGAIYRDQEQIRMGNIRKLNKQSEKKVLKIVDTAALKRELESYITKYIQTPLIRDMLEDLVINNRDFFKWPAATRLHHAYKGGLAVHTTQVVKNAVGIWHNYQGRNLDIEAVIAGAMLHDIGKLSEYNEDGSRTTFGDMISHLVDGVERITDYCATKGVNANSDRKILVIKHIVLSHHEKLEWGSPTTPSILEAVIVAKADAMDAVIESINKELDNTEPEMFTDRVFVADGNKFIKW